MAGQSSKDEKMLKFFNEKRMQVKFDLDGTPYKPLENIGTGAYGVVCSAVDVRNERKVAIKKIPNAFAAHTVTKRTLREVKILRHFFHDNIIAVLDMLHQTGTDVYIVFDLMETDLHHIIHSKQPLTERHVQYFMYQILRGLKYIHSANIIHRDLKPSNLMVNANCLLKIGDFGMARSFTLAQNGDDGYFMTQYVATRWYRAPELLFSLLDYSFSVDIWSVGCILAEMLNKRQLFPGKDHISQMKLIIYYLGTPSEQIMKCIPSDLVKNIIIGLGLKAPLPWPSIVPKASMTGIDLLSKLLQMAPWDRTTAAESLNHEFLKEFSNPLTEITCEPFTLLVDVEHLNPEQLKQAMFEEVKDFRKCAENSAAPSDFYLASTIQSNTESAGLPKADSSANSYDADVEMLSAKLEEVKFKIVPTDPVQQQPMTDAEMNPVKAALLRKIISRQENKECEKKTNKKERKRRKSQSKTKDSTEVLPVGLSEQDQTLLERWSKLQEQSKRNQNDKSSDSKVITIVDDSSEDEEETLEDELEDIIVNALPCLDSVKNEKTPSSAQLMEDWIIAANVNPEFLKEIEKQSVHDFAMK